VYPPNDSEATGFNLVKFSGKVSKATSSEFDGGKKAYFQLRGKVI